MYISSVPSDNIIDATTNIFLRDLGLLTIILPEIIEINAARKLGISKR
jgi:hypothetical protein